MKTHSLVRLSATAWVILGHFLVRGATELTPAQPPIVVSADAHSRLVQQVWQAADDGSLSTNSYVALATGLNRLEDGAWVPAVPQLEQMPGGCIVASKTAHQLILAADLNTEGAVDLLTPDGVRLRSSPLGVAAFDVASGRSVMLASVTNCQAVLVSPTEAIYPFCLDGLMGSIRYSIALDRLEQDIILHERIPPETLEALNLNPATVRIEILTEFFRSTRAGQSELWRRPLSTLSAGPLSTSCR